MRRKLRNNALLACVFIALGLVVMVLTENRIRDMQRLRVVGISVEARVVEMETRSGGRNSSSSYWLHTAVVGESAAVPRELHVSVAKSDYASLSVGAEVDLVYDPQHVENVELRNAVTRWDADVFRQERSRLTLTITVVLLSVVFFLRVVDVFVTKRVLRDQQRKKS